MKTLKNYNQFIKEEHTTDLQRIMDEYISRVYQGEYNYDIRGWNSDRFTIEVYHVADERGEPGEDFKDQIAEDNKEAAEELIRLLNAKGWGVWEIEEEVGYSHMGFTLTQISDPRDSSDTVRYHRESKVISWWMTDGGQDPDVVFEGTPEECENFIEEQEEPYKSRLEIEPVSVEEMEKALRDTNFFVGGLTNDQIKYYYNKHIKK